MNQSSALQKNLSLLKLEESKKLNPKTNMYFAVTNSALNRSTIFFKVFGDWLNQIAKCYIGFN
jgi:hypothetical protein